MTAATTYKMSSSDEDRDKYDNIEREDECSKRKHSKTNIGVTLVRKHNLSSNKSSSLLRTLSDEGLVGIP